MVGHEVAAPTKLDSFKRRMQTVYMADKEDGAWRPIVKKGNEGPDVLQKLDVFNVGQLPNSTSEDAFLGRRVAKARHRQGANYLFLDWYAEYIDTKDMNINYWRDK